MENYLAKQMTHTYQGDANAIGPLGRDLRNRLPDYLRGLGMGLSTDVLGGPVDLVSSVMRPFGYSVPPEDTIGSSDWLNKKIGVPMSNSISEIAGRLTTGMLTPDPMMAKLIGLAGVTAYHGSPHKFDKFKLDKIGTGEGAQAYGHGMYFAENPATAKAYQITTSGKGEVKVPGSFDSKFFQDFDVPLNDVRATAQDLMSREAFSPGYLKTVADNETYLGRVAQGILDGKITAPKGQLYKVDISDDAVKNFLDWDKPLSQQPESVRKAFKDLMDLKGVESYVVDGNRVYLGVGEESAMLGQDIYRNLGASSPDKASGALKQMGIPGIRYLDQGSREAGKGSSNFVVFDEDIIKVLERK